MAARRTPQNAERAGGRADETVHLPFDFCVSRADVHTLVPRCMAQKRNIARSVSAKIGRVPGAGTILSLPRLEGFA